MVEEGAGGPPIYSFFGHGMHIDKVMEIPKGCMLITLAKCGNISYFGPDTAFRKLTSLFENPEHIDLLRDPVRNKSTIQDMIGMEINVNYPEAPHEINRKYYEIEYTAQLVAPIIDGFILHKSGLYRPGTTSLETIKRNKVSDFTDDDVKYLYEHSLYPTYDEVEKKSAETELKGNVLINKIGQDYSIRQSQLFEKFPGIYYFMTCRVASKKEAQKGFDVRLSIRKQLSRSPNIIPDYDVNPSLILYNREQKEFHGNIGEKFRLPIGVKHQNYIYINKGSKLLDINEQGHEIIEIVPKTEEAPVLGGLVNNGADNGAVGGAGEPRVMLRRAEPMSAPPGIMLRRAEPMSAPPGIMLRRAEPMSAPPGIMLRRAEPMSAPPGIMLRRAETYRGENEVAPFEPPRNIRLERVMATQNKLADIITDRFEKELKENKSISDIRSIIREFTKETMKKLGFFEKEINRVSIQVGEIARSIAEHIRRADIRNLKTEIIRLVTEGMRGGGKTKRRNTKKVRKTRTRKFYRRR